MEDRNVRFFSVDKECAYLEIAKAACTSIEVAMLGAEDPGDGVDIHTSEDWQIDRYFRYRLLPPAESFSFTFVRNPLDRLVSCYVDKIRNRQDGSGLEKYFDTYRGGGAFPRQGVR